MVIFPQLETNITTYCQNKCVSCNHMMPLVEYPAHVAPEIIERDLAILSPFVHSDAYAILGGEPTMHPAIMDIIRIVKRSGITDKVLCATNGQSMRHLPNAFYRELDHLAVTPYKIDAEEKAYISDKCREFNLSLEWHFVGFTRSFYRNKHNPEYAAQKYKNCWFLHNRSVIDNGYLYRCCTSPFIPFFLLGKTKEADGLCLDGITEQKIIDYMGQPETPEICYVCGSNNDPQIGWRETTREKWLEDSLG